MGEWQPIETAPTDGTRILICSIKENIRVIVNASWFDLKEIKRRNWPENMVGWWGYTSFGAASLFNKEYEPSYWMPLPELPE
jgi:hypothetical protein